MTDPRAIADALITAQRDRRPIAPFSSVNPFLDADTAYKAQALVVEHRLQAGENLIGAKLGFTSRVKRLALGINEPVYGRLTSRMVVPYGDLGLRAGMDELVEAHRFAVWHDHARCQPAVYRLVDAEGEALDPAGESLSLIHI